MRPTKAGNGSYLQLEIEILEGQYKGRRLWDRLTLNHPNAVAVQIAQGIGSGERILRTTERPSHLAKNRLALPDELPLSWPEFAKHIPA